MTTLSAAAAAADITPPVGVMMDGYGNRLTPSEGVHDPLSARALVLDYGNDGACAIVSCDLLGMHPWIAEKVRERTNDATGIPRDAIVVAATHNHAAPVGLRAGMFSRLDETLAEMLIERIVGAITAAWAARRPATLKTGRATVDTISMNRRDPEWPADNELAVALLDGEDGPIAALLAFACHATVLSGANLQLSGEFPAAACRIVEQATGATPVYLNGACGNVNPTWITQDFASVERAGQVLGGQAVRTIAELRAAGPGQRAHNIRWDEFTDKPSPGRTVKPRLRFARRAVDLPLRTFASDEDYVAWTSDVEARVAALRERSPAHREATAQLQRWQAERWAAAWSRRGEAGPTQRTEVQALSLGAGLALLALPGEFFAETATLIRRAAGVEQLLVACYANDYVGYVIPEDAFQQGGYESGVTFFAPRAEAIIRQASVELLREVHGS